jgi:hypothetical protein
VFAAVSSGAIQFTDEVTKSMFFMKLWATTGLFVVAVLAAAGVAGAARSEVEPGGLSDVDRQAVQGSWRHNQADLTKAIRTFNLKRGALRTSEKLEVAPPPRPKLAPRSLDPKEDIVKLIAARKFADAERILRRRLPDLTGLDAAQEQLLLGVCVLERARGAEPPDAALWDEAADLFRKAANETKDAPADNRRAVWVRTQAELRGLRVLQDTRRSDALGGSTEITIPAQGV